MSTCDPMFQRGLSRSYQCVECLLVRIVLRFLVLFVRCLPLRSARFVASLLAGTSLAALPCEVGRSLRSRALYA